MKPDITDPFGPEWSTLPDSPPPGTEQLGTGGNGSREQVGNGSAYIDVDGFDEGPATEPDSDEDAAEARRAAQRERLERMLAEQVGYERIRRQAKRIIDAEDHAAGWRPPVEYGTLADELAMPEEPVTYRVERMMPTGANVVLTAQFKAGKTTLVNNLVRVLADGGDFLGRYPVRPVSGRVGVFNYEVGAAQYRRWLRAMGIRRPDRVAMLHLRGLRLPMTTGAIEQWVIDWLKRHEVEVWVLDPYARALIGSAEENDNSGVATFLDTLDVIKEQAGVTELVMPAHTGRAEQEAGQERARGATRIDDWPDVRWVLVKDKDGRRYITASGRDVDEAEQALGYDDETRGLTIVGAGRVATRRVDLRVEVLQFITSNPGFSAQEVASAFNKRKSDVTACLAVLEQTGAVRVDVGVRGKKMYYALNDRIGPDVPWNQPDLRAGLW